MPINRHMTFSDRQAEAARVKKLQQAVPSAAPVVPTAPGSESVSGAATEPRTAPKATLKKNAQKAVAAKPVASKKAPAASKKKSGKGK